MESDWAAENLRVIRTLMERSAIYRRALAPMMLLAGSAGTVAATAGWLAGIEAPRAFSGYWLGVAVLTIAGCFLLLRRQALRDGEPLWSPPTRRVLQALLVEQGARRVDDVALALAARGPQASRCHAATIQSSDDRVKH